MKTIQLQYFASLREKSGKSLEERETQANTAEELYRELSEHYDFNLSAHHLRVAINDEFSEMSSEIKKGDRVVFIPPVAGG